MVLEEEAGDRITFRFKGRSWSLVTLAIGVVLLVVTASVYLRDRSANMLALSVIGAFGVLMLYSSAYSWTATQWLRIDGRTNRLHFHKQNLYGLVDWDKPGSDFKAIRVWKYRKASNWSITLVDRDDYGLHLGENAFGAFSHERARDLAKKVSSRSGIPIDDAQVRAADAAVS